MIWFLRALFAVVLASMLWVTSWASFQCPLFAVPREETRNVARLFDIAKADTAGYEAYAEKMARLCGSGRPNCGMLSRRSNGTKMARHSPMAAIWGAHKAPSCSFNPPRNSMQAPTRSMQ